MVCRNPISPPPIRSFEICRMGGNLNSWQLGQVRHCRKGPHNKLSSPKMKYEHQTNSLKWPHFLNLLYIWHSDVASIVPMSIEQLDPILLYHAFKMWARGSFLRTARFLYTARFLRDRISMRSNLRNRGKRASNNQIGRFIVYHNIVFWYFWIRIQI